MKNKLEQKLDAEFKRMGITFRVYHFRTEVAPFTSVTIVDEIITWASARTKLNTRLSRYFMEGEKTPATYLIKSLREIEGIYGIAICDGRDQFNGQRGRIIAKGRLWKHLKEIDK